LVNKGGYDEVYRCCLSRCSQCFACVRWRVQGGQSDRIVAPITTAVSVLNVNALNNVSVLNGNKVSLAAIAPISLKNTNILSGILGGGSHGCGCN
jgi:hypothetical protein